MVTLIVAQLEQTEARPNTASPGVTSENEMQPGSAYSNAAVVDVSDVAPLLPFDAPPPYSPPTFEKSKNVNEEPANVVEMQTGSSTPNPRRWAPFKEEEVSLLPTIAGTQPEGAEEFKQHWGMKTTSKKKRPTSYVEEVFMMHTRCDMVQWLFLKPCIDITFVFCPIIVALVLFIFITVFSTH